MPQSIVFISYSQKNEKEKDTLLSHLGILQRAGLIDLWSDDRIKAGSNWQQEIQQAIAQARVAILLISADFLSSDFILDTQIPALLRRQESEGLVVLSIIARDCAWQKIDWLVKTKIRPKNGHPVWRSGGLYVDEDLAVIAAEIADIIEAGETVTKSDAMPSLPSPDPTSQYHPCFISYSHKDDAFAQKLYADLKQHGVDCWIATENIKIGDKLRPTIDRSIRTQDKLLLILSGHSINSDWVEQEVEAAFEEESKHKKAKLFPVRLDETVMETEQAWAATIRRTRLIGDFSRWKDHDAYQQTFERLLRDLKVEK